MALSLHIDDHSHCGYLAYTPNIEALSGELYRCEDIPIDLKKIKIINVVIDFHAEIGRLSAGVSSEFKIILGNLLSAIPNSDMLESLRVKLSGEDYYIQYKRDDYIAITISPSDLCSSLYFSYYDYPGELLSKLPHKRLICYNFTPSNDFKYMSDVHPSNIEMEIYLFPFCISRERVLLDSFAVNQTTVCIYVPTGTYVIVDISNTELNNGTY